MARSTESLNSKARISFCNVLQRMDITFKKSNDDLDSAIFSKYTYQDFWTRGMETDGIVRKFPFILRGDGTPWDIANQYLMVRFQTECITGEPSISTYTRKAEQLLQFLRWIESNQAEGRAVSEFTFPEQKQNKVTYAYRRYLRRLIQGGWSIDSAKLRISTVVNFYRWIMRYYPEKLDSTPFEESTVTVQKQGVFNTYGFKLVTTDLAFKKSGSGNAVALQRGEIMDAGERLRPFNSEEQELFQKHLSLYGNYTFQLMCWMALHTGARIQTIATMRISTLKDAVNHNRKKDIGTYLVKVGAGTPVECKYSKSKLLKSYDLHVPVELMDLLLEYADSVYARECREKHFYGDNDENYLFLTDRGTPYITSRKELQDRANPIYSKRINPKDRVDFPIAKGQSIWQWVNRLLKQIRMEEPDFRDFRFHDLRATFALDEVNRGLDSGEADSDISENLARKMGHSDPRTSMAYVRYDRMSEKIAQHQKYHSDKIRANITKYGLGHFKEMGDK